MRINKEPNTHVDGNYDGDDQPDRAIEQRNPERIPGQGDPTLKLMKVKMYDRVATS
jgi:hypothetical protein